TVGRVSTFQSDVATSKDTSMEMARLFRLLAVHLGDNLGTPTDQALDVADLFEILAGNSSTKAAELASLHNSSSSSTSSSSSSSSSLSSTFSFLVLFSGEEGCWSHLLNTIASIHAASWGRSILAVVWDASDDQLEHLALIHHVSVVSLPSGCDNDEFIHVKRSFEDDLERFERVLYVPTGRLLLNGNVCNGTDDSPPLVSRSRKEGWITSPERWAALRDHPRLLSSTWSSSHQYHDLHFGEALHCLLQLRVPMPQPGPESLADSGKPKVCLVICSYNAAGSPADTFSLNSVVVRSLGEVLTNRTFERADVYVYVGTQAGDTWDQPEWKRAFLLMAGHLTGHRVGFRVFRYPLVGRLVDITAKYNMLMLQAYADGCDYMYQYSDDSEFQHTASDWPLSMIDSFEARQGFGTWGLVDPSAETMTLGASSRSHIALQGWFWPPILKNWYSDNFIENVYGPLSVHQEDAWFQNKQNYGQRYANCDHFLQYKVGMLIAAARALLWSVKVRREHVGLFSSLVQDRLKDLLSTVQKERRNPTIDDVNHCPGHLSPKKLIGSSSAQTLERLLAVSAPLFRSLLDNKPPAIVRFSELQSTNCTSKSATTNKPTFEATTGSNPPIGSSVCPVREPPKSDHNKPRFAMHVIESLNEMEAQRKELLDRQQEFASRVVSGQHQWAPRNAPPPHPPVNHPKSAAAPIAPMRLVLWGLVVLPSISSFCGLNL
ncbi:MAG: hypothetical protein Q8P67_14610, partial [archaeon]|nr:hypothetical protein [archaeon]